MMMNQRSLVALTLGVASLACVTGVFEPRGQPPVAIQALADGGERSVIHGIVREAKSDYGLEGALVLLQCTCLQDLGESVTIAGGAYRFSDLPPGKYSIQVLYKHANVSRSFELVPGVRVQIDFRVDPDTRFIVG